MAGPPGIAGLNVAVCIPFIDTGCDWRRRAFDFTFTHWESLGLPVVVGMASGEPINRSAARNEASRHAHADVIVFCDADTWVEADAFAGMTGLAASSGRLVHGYTKHLKLTKAATVRTYAAGAVVPTGETILNQPSGCIAVSRELLEMVGGHDERFVGWGGEDRAFELACHTLAGPGHRIKGVSYHLWHPNAPEKGRGMPTRRANQALALRYKELSGSTRPAGILPRTTGKQPDPPGMLSLLSEPGGPLDRSIRVVANG